jgi:hypothetical protein
MQMVKGRVWSAIGCLAVGCAAASPKTTASRSPRPEQRASAASSATPPSTFQQALTRARERRRQAESLVFVVPPDVPTGDARVALLVEWLGKREDASRAVEALYATAREQATPPEQVLVERERGELRWALFDAKLRATLSIFPGVENASAERAAAVRAVVLKRFASDLAQARERFVACLMLGSQLGLKNDDTSACERQVRAIDALTTPKKEPDPILEKWRYARLQDAPRARRQVSHVGGCVLNGTAATSWTKLFSSAEGERYDVVLEDFDVLSLELPTRPDGRAKLSVDYPFQASGFIDLDSGAITTAIKIELVPGHIWLDPGTSVRAFNPSGDQISIERAAGEQSLPKVALRLPCSALSLAIERADLTAEAKGEVSQMSGVVPLFGRPNGSKIGQVDAETGVNVRVLGRQPGWIRITNHEAGVSLGTVPYEFDAWVADKLVAGQGFGIATLAFRGDAPTHVTVRPLPLRLSADPHAAIFAELVPGITLLVGSEQGDMRRIRFNQAHGHNEGNDFWVTREDLASRAQLK